MDTIKPEIPELQNKEQNGQAEIKQPELKKAPSHRGSFFQATYLKWLLGALAAIIILLLVFQIGAYVGYRRANFAFQWGDNYNRAFGGPKNGFLRDFSGRDMVSGHGTAGTIAKIESNDIVIKDQQGLEKIVNIIPKTAIKSGVSDIQLSEMRLDERVVIIGSPVNDGSINAEIIRVFPDDELSEPASFFTPKSKFD